MDKLFKLLSKEPLVIHDYLQKTIFPLHMRSQRLKLSASGQGIYIRTFYCYLVAASVYYSCVLYLCVLYSSLYYTCVSYNTNFLAIFVLYSCWWRYAV